MTVARLADLTVKYDAPTPDAFAAALDARDAERARVRAQWSEVQEWNWRETRGKTYALLAGMKALAARQAAGNVGQPKPERHEDEQGRVWHTSRTGMVRLTGVVNGGNP